MQPLLYHTLPYLLGFGLAFALWSGDARRMVMAAAITGNWGFLTYLYAAWQIELNPVWNFAVDGVTAAVVGVDILLEVYFSHRARHMPRYAMIVEAALFISYAVECTCHLLQYNQPYSYYYSILLVIAWLQAATILVWSLYDGSKSAWNRLKDRGDSGGDLRHGCQIVSDCHRSGSGFSHVVGRDNLDCETHVPASQAD